MVLANQKTCPPSLFEFITLITYLFSFLLFACPCASLCLPTVAHTSTLPGVLAYQQRIVDTATAKAKQYQEFNTLVTRIKVRIMRLKGRRVKG